MRFWDDATYPDDLPDDQRPQICVMCGADCEPDDYQEEMHAFVCRPCEVQRMKQTLHYAEVFARR